MNNYIFKTFIHVISAGMLLSCDGQTTGDNKSDTDTDSVCIPKDTVVNISSKSEPEPPTNKDVIMDITSLEGLRVYTPNYTSIDHVCKDMPSPDDSTIIMMCAAAFTGSRLDEFKHTNIAGHHVSGGTLYKGYACKANTGCFAWYADSKTWEFGIGNYDNLIKKAETAKGMAFGQGMVIYNSKIQEKQPLELTRTNEYRVLAEYKDKLVIIDSENRVVYKDFVDALQRIGVKHALYLDMGGWNYSWYRDNDGKVKYIHDKKTKYATNWIVFKR